MDKIPLVLWSGGLDSTYIVWDNIANGRAIDVVYINLENNTDKVNREIKARDKLKERFNKFETNIRKDYVIDVPSFIQGENLSNESSFVQPFVWSYALQSIFDSNRHSHVETGYIKEDDFWTIKEAFENFVNVGSKTFFTRESEIKLEFPLQWKSKEDILSGFNGNGYGKGLLEDITWCEAQGRVDGKWTMNCSCTPCKKMRKIKLFLEYEEGRNEHIE